MSPHICANIISQPPQMMSMIEFITDRSLIACWYFDNFTLFTWYINWIFGFFCLIFRSYSAVKNYSWFFSADTLQCLSHKFFIMLSLSAVSADSSYPSNGDPDRKFWVRLEFFSEAFLPYAPIMG